MRATTPLLFLVAALVAPGCGGDAGHGNADAPGSVERMAAEHASDAPVASGAVETAPRSPVRAESVQYGSVGGSPLTGYLARPADAGGPLPGLIVIHEWWGLNANVRAMAERLAGEGYLALAVDLYGGEVAESPERARELVGAAMQRAPDLQENLRQAYAFLADTSGAPRVGTIGWCFGGGWSLQAALLLPDELDAAVIYYGRLVTERERLATLAMPVLGIFGSEDRSIPVAAVRAFEATLVELGKSVEVHVYEGADHAFANPSGTRYDAAAAEDAWRQTTAFLARHLLR